ncbi:MAG: UTP--glucose-1-phosphate uridylyltransferase GalU [Rickettsiales bacterium]|nr:UTP--glucose-1-phosphate uridylyltransferase GalU [Rickettsiales bacterium]
MAQKIRKVVFPVGGLGTRFLPATKSMAKEMLPVVSKPLIHYAFEEARDAGIEQFIFVTGRNKVAITNHFDHSYELQSTLSKANKEKELELAKSWLPAPGNVIFTRQQEPLGLGHAIWCARNIIGDEPFAVILADDLVQSTTPCLKQLISAYEEIEGSHLVAVMDVPRADTRKYGVLDVQSEQGRLAKAKALVEKPAPEDAPSTLSIIGRYILQPDIFDILAAMKKGAGGEIQLTDAINESCRHRAVYGYRFEGRRFDCGEHAGFVEANLAYALADAELGPKVREFIKNYV